MIASTKPQTARFWDALDQVYHALSRGQNEGASRALTPNTVMHPQGLWNPLGNLRDLFGLSEFELNILLLCAGTAIDRRFGLACAVAQPNCELATFGLAMEVFERPHWSVLSRLRPLRYWRLIELGAGPTLQAALSIDERILQYLLDVPASDERLEALVHPLEEPEGEAFDARSAGLGEAVRRGSLHWCSPSAKRRSLLIAGARTEQRTAVFRAMCAEAGLQPFALDASDLPEYVVERERLARIATREAALVPSAYLIRTSRLENTKHLEAWLDRLDAPVAIETEPGSVAERMPGIHLTVPVLTGERRKAIWRDRLGSVAETLNGELDAIADGFALDAQEIGEVAATLQDEASLSQSKDGSLVRSAWRLSREAARRSLDDLAKRVDSRAHWEDLVLPDPQIAILRQIVAHSRQAGVVHGEWGFADRESRGLGLSALFSGASGTGKTMAAGVLARELDRDLYQIDLATVVSKYIGETEKHLRRVFDEAERSGSILLFDEADALFGKRSQVRDSHDRYANLEVSYLLQRMEAYRGIAILTTNMQNALDPAFLRRLRFVIQVPFPDAPSRVRIWRSAFPERAPTSALDFDRLAQLNVTGGVIRNIALLSAFLAASEGSSIEMRHCLEAARTEFAKLDRSVTAAETRGWE